jgi:hypothetical protein
MMRFELVLWIVLHWMEAHQVDLQRARRGVPLQRLSPSLERRDLRTFRLTGRLHRGAGFARPGAAGQQRDQDAERRGGEPVQTVHLQLLSHW